MPAPRPEDLVVKPTRRQKSVEGQGGVETKKIPPKFILIGGVIAVAVLAFAMIPSNKPTQTKQTVVENKQTVKAFPQEEKPQAPQSIVPAETSVQTDAAITSAESNLKSIAQHVAALDTEIQNLTNASERLGQVGDQEGRNDVEHQIAGLALKRKELASQYDKWTAYRKDLFNTKTVVAGGK